MDNGIGLLILISIAGVVLLVAGFTGAASNVWFWGQAGAFVVGLASLAGLLGRLGERLIIPAFIVFIACGVLWGIADPVRMPLPEMCGSGRFEWEC